VYHINIPDDNLIRVLFIVHRIQGKNYLFLGNESCRELLEVLSV
jgi:hypothetical protein